LPAPWWILPTAKSQIVFVQPTDDRFTDDPKQRRPDISKAQRVLGWEPKVQLAEGLKQTLDYFRDKV
jgi:nucleoside-diphosphate-sugar epimerase